VVGESLRHVVVANDHGFINGGAAKVAIESALWLKGRGLGVSFVAGSGPMDPRLAGAGVECVTVAPHDVLTDPDRHRAMRNGLWNREAARVLAGHIARLDPSSTVVHIHTWTKALSPSVGPVVTRSSTAHVCTLHEYFLACPNGAFYDYNAGSICTKRALGLSCLTTQCDARRMAHKAWRVARQGVLWTAGRMPRNLREVIYISPKQRSIIGDYFGEGTRWHHLPNAVGERPERRVPVEENDVFLFIGRIAPEKGAVIAAEAARRAGVRIVFAGEGPDGAAVRRAHPGAELPGWLGAEDLGRWMRRARCLVFPSLWYEGYPLVVADALRLGLPILVSTNTTATALIEDGRNGLHVPAGDVEAWARAMRQMTSDETAKDMGEAAFRSGGDLIGYEEYTDRLIGIYENVLARRLGCPSPHSIHDAGEVT
jgi:glycosyltransferase involved in cell wall biosynthesis